jgi:beta-N-acetylhexosaminidase
VTPGRNLPAALVLAAAVVLPVGLLSTGSSAAPPALAVDPAAASTAPTAAPCFPAPLPDRAAAVLMVGLPEVRTASDPLAVEVAHLGVGGIFLGSSNVGDAEQVRSLVAGLRAAAPRPLLVTTDAESGRVSVLRTVLGPGPSPRRLAAEESPEEVRRFAAALGGRLADLGVDLDLAPVLDLDDGAWDGIIGDRSFSSDPERAAAYGLAFQEGLADAGVDAAVKHFPGQGRSGADTHLRVATVRTPMEDVIGRDLVPFQRLIDAGAAAVMLNHLDYAALDGDLPASLSPAAYALLRSTGFRGVAMTDSLGMGAVNTRWDFPEAAVRAIAAGADLAFATDGRQAERMRDALVRAVRAGRLPERRLDEAATRVGRLAGAPVEQLTCTPD